MRRMLFGAVSALTADAILNLDGTATDLLDRVLPPTNAGLRPSDAILLILAAALYLQVGYQQWVLILLLDPESEKSPIANKLASYTGLPWQARWSLQMTKWLHVTTWPVLWLIVYYRRLTEKPADGKAVATGCTR